MSSSFRFLAHEKFISQIQDFEKSHPEAFKSLLTQLEKSRADPYGGGRMMHNVPQHLQGKVFRLWVKGKKGFRYIYRVDRGRSSVYGIFVSPVSRSKFDYSKYPWQKLLEEIDEDLISGNLDKFQVWSFQPRNGP